MSKFTWSLTTSSQYFSKFKTSYIQSHLWFSSSTACRQPRPTEIILIDRYFDSLIHRYMNWLIIIRTKCIGYKFVNDRSHYVLSRCNCSISNKWVIFLRLLIWNYLDFEAFTLYLLLLWQIVTSLSIPLPICHQRFQVHIQDISYLQFTTRFGNCRILVWQHAYATRTSGLRNSFWHVRLLGNASGGDQSVLMQIVFRNSLSVCAVDCG